MYICKCIISAYKASKIKECYSTYDVINSHSAVGSITEFI